MIADEATKKDDLMWAMERPCSQDKYLFHISDLSVLVIVTVSSRVSSYLHFFPWSFSSCSLFIGSKLMDLIFYLIYVVLRFVRFESQSQSQSQSELYYIYIYDS